MCCGHYSKSWSESINLSNLWLTLKLRQVTNESLHYINIWFYGIFLKLIPCIVLTILTALLVKALVQVAHVWILIPLLPLTPSTQAMKRAQRLRQGKAHQQPNGREEVQARWEKITQSLPPQRSGGGSRQKRTDRTTRLLIVILVLFLVTEFPQVGRETKAKIILNFRSMSRMGWRFISNDINDHRLVGWCFKLVGV